MDVGDHIFTADVNIKMCSKLWQDDLIQQLRQVWTVRPVNPLLLCASLNCAAHAKSLTASVHRQFSFLGYIKFAFPSIQSPLTETELLDENALIRVSHSATGDQWCSDIAGECCCDDPTEWNIQGRFLNRRHAQDFIYHATEALPAQIMRQMGICAAPSYSGRIP